MGLTSEYGVSVRRVTQVSIVQLHNVLKTVGQQEEFVAVMALVSSHALELTQVGHADTPRTSNI